MAGSARTVDYVGWSASRPSVRPCARGLHVQAREKRGRTDERTVTFRRQTWGGGPLASDPGGRWEWPGRRRQARGVGRRPTSDPCRSTRSAPRSRLLIRCVFERPPQQPPRVSAVPASGISGGSLGRRGLPRHAPTSRGSDGAEHEWQMAWLRQELSRERRRVGVDVGRGLDIEASHARVPPQGTTCDCSSSR